MDTQNHNKLDVTNESVTHIVTQSGKLYMPDCAWPRTIFIEKNKKQILGDSAKCYSEIITKCGSNGLIGNIWYGNLVKQLWVFRTQIQTKNIVDLSFYSYEYQKN